MAMLTQWFRSGDRSPRGNAQPNDVDVEAAYELLFRIADAVGDEERRAVVYEHPELIVPGVAEALGKVKSRFARGWRERLIVSSALLFVRARRGQAEGAPGEYPFGPGPVEQIWSQRQRGEITAAYAAELARQPQVVRSIAPPYAVCLTNYAQGRAVAGDWREALEFQHVLLALAAALPERAWAQQSRATIDLAWVNVALLVLVQIPDARILREARAAGDQLVERARAARDEDLTARALYMLGILHLDPYTSGREPYDMRAGLQRWEQRLADELGDELLRLDAAELRMPSPREALRTAETYLRQAAEASAGQQRGIALEGLAVALLFLRASGEEVGADELAEVSRSALRLLDRVADEPYWRMANQALAAAEGAARPADGGTVDLRLPEGGETRAVALERELARIVEPRAVDVPTWRPRGGAATVAEDLRAQAERESWDPADLAVALIGVTQRAAEWRDAEVGLELLDQARVLDPSLDSEHRPAIAYAAAELRVALGRQSFRSGDVLTGLRAYEPALAGYLDLGLDGRALDVVRAAGVAAGFPQVLEAATEHAAIGDTQAAIVDLLAPHALRLEMVAGDAATNVLQDFCRDVVESIIGRPVQEDFLFFVWRLAKGLRFAATVEQRAAYRVEDDPVGRDLLADVARLAPTAYEPTDIGEPFDEELVLSAYVRPEDLSPGGTAEERIANLRHAFDHRLNQALLAGLSIGADAFETIDDLRSQLDSETVLLDMYLGTDESDRITSYVLFITQEDGRVAARTIGQPGEHLVWTRRHGRELRHGPLALWVAEQRHAVQEEPFGRAISTRGGRLLERALEQLLGSGVDILADYRRQGKRHLCVVPHGALHYYPIHLAGLADEPLAAEWTVTYLPNVRLLGRDRHPSTERRAVASVGLDFDKESGALVPLRHAESEARRVAHLFGIEPVLGPAATKPAVINALQTSRFVHLATHGKHDENAPALQALFLAPVGGDDRLHAYEVYALDLAGLELVTLGACETGLGRFDLADNLRGLPASLFVAGTSAIIGTLWPVEDETSESFFVSLYERLAGGAGTLDAFHAAQGETRRSHPEYRDWGAFVYLGDWREPQEAAAP